MFFFSLDKKFKMITKNILNNKKTLTNLIFIRNRIHPIPAKVVLDLKFENLKLNVYLKSFF